LVFIVTDRRKQDRLGRGVALLRKAVLTQGAQTGRSEGPRCDKKPEKAMQRIQPADLSELLNGDDDGRNAWTSS